jgi:hypothetical protein
MSLDHMEAQLAAEARYASDHRQADDSTEGAGLRANLSGALHDVSERLSAPSIGRDERMALLQRQAELGDLRDEIELRDRRRATTRPPRHR